jgi:hypothetical protein
MMRRSSSPDHTLARARRAFGDDHPSTRRAADTRTAALAALATSTDVDDE